MPLETLNTVFAGLTFVVIAVTAVAATVQLRHLRSSTQITALITLLEDWKQPDFQSWAQFVRRELPERMRDPEFVRGLLDPRPDRSIHSELHICDYFEQLGSYFKYGMLDLSSYLDVAAFTIADLYRNAKPCIDKMRELRGESLYENFEYLAVQSELWNKRHPKGAYPRGLPRFADIAK
jgi:hypothetical protein